MIITHKGITIEAKDAYELLVAIAAIRRELAQK